MFIFILDARHTITCISVQVFKHLINEQMNSIYKFFRIKIY